MKTREGGVFTSCGEPFAFPFENSDFFLLWEHGRRQTASLTSRVRVIVFASDNNDVVLVFMKIFEKRDQKNFNNNTITPAYIHRITVVTSSIHQINIQDAKGIR
jgi:hypothetical protein